MISTIQRYIIGGLLLVILVEGGLSYYFKKKSDENHQNTLLAQAELVAERERIKGIQIEKDIALGQVYILRTELNAAREAVTFRDDQIQQIQRERDEKDIKLKEAMRANRVWADQPVPDGVRVLLEED